MRGTVVKRRTKKGEIRYAIKYYLPNGRQRWETIGPNKKEAERELAARLSALSAGTYRELKDATFEEFALLWIDRAEARLKPSTHASYARCLVTHLVPEFGAYPLRSLTTGQIQDWVDRTLAKGLAPKSVNNFLVVLKKMLKDAVRWEYLAANPAADVERVRVPHREMRALSAEQVKRFLAAVEPDYWLLFTVAVFTGLRRGELLALQWGDVDWEKARLNVRRSVWKGRFIGPKTVRSTRSVDLAPQVLDALRAARPQLPADSLRAQLVFSGPNGRPLEPDNMVKRHFLPALERAELPRIRFHDLRHTYASLLLVAGEHPKYVQSQLGHASITTTLDRYSHLLPGAYSHGGERLERTVLGEEPLPRPEGRLSGQPG